MNLVTVKDSKELKPLAIALVETAVTSLVYSIRTMRKMRRNYSENLKSMKPCCIELSFLDK
jgi:hypothetical protein